MDLVLVADLAEEVGRTRSNLLKIIKKRWPGKLRLIPRETDRGIQDMAALPAETADEVRTFYRNARSAGG